MNGYEPRRPALIAAGLLSVWIVILALPMLQGQWLASPYGDQYAAGFAFRLWGAEQWRALGHPPLWNPTLFAGLPFLGAGHGDVFYPTSFLRLVLPVTTVVNLGFVLHYIAAGVVTYFWLRKLGVSWSGAVVGGLAYQLSGLIASYAAPGHDGKLFASTALPLGMLALVMALRERRWMGYPLLAISVALSILGHFQLAYYYCVAIGIFALYLVLGERTAAEPLGPVLGRLAGVLGAVLVGFAATAIQILPFFAYVPFSPRAEAYSPELGYAAAASYAIPWTHVPEFFLAKFVGAAGSYWGSNPLKYHSEYLGLPVIGLAILGALDRGQRRFVWWFGGIGLLFLLVSLGGSTPFYRVWWAVMPLMKKVRAAGMAFFLPSFIIATFAAFGVDRLIRREAAGAKHARIWLAAGSAVVLLAVAGVWASIAQSIAMDIPPSPWRDPLSVARSSRSAITLGALGSGVALVLTGGIGLGWMKGRLNAAPLALLLALVVGGDLWRNAAGFWIYTRDHEQIYRPDPIIERMRQQPLPYRVLELGIFNPGFGVYPGDGVALMAFGIPQLLGHHGNELHRFDELMGGKNQWRNLSPQILDLFAVRYLVGAAGPQMGDIPGYRVIMDSTPASTGALARLYEQERPSPYVRVVPQAAEVPDSLTVQTLLSPRFPGFDQLVLLPPDAPVHVPPSSLPPDAAPAAGQTRGEVTAWKPGAMTIALEPPPLQPGYMLVAENWYPDWRATVDGSPAAVMRGNHTLITVPVPAGARHVELDFRSASYERGKLLSLAAVFLLLLAMVVPLTPAGRRRRRGG